MLYALELDSLSIAMMNGGQTLPYIVDPSCGSGTFLIEAMRMVTSEVKRRRRGELSPNRTVGQRFDDLFMPEHREHRWARDFVYGIEHNFDLATAAKVNMILHGDGASNIFHQDGLKPFRYFTSSGGAGERLKNTARSPSYRDLDVNARFDVVISNPPFSVDLDADTKRMLGTSFLFGDKRNSENLFVERYYQLLVEGERMAIVLPESVFDTTENKYIRLFLFWYFEVMAVVSLPQSSFEPYTQTKTSILFARKKTAADVEAWRASWSAGVGEYGRLRTRALNYVQVFLEGAKQSRFPSIAGDDAAAVRETIAAFAGSSAERLDEDETLAAFVERHRLLIEETAECDADRASPFGACNTAWVFARVAARHGGLLFSAEVANVGYRRSKRGISERPNELFELEVAPGRIDRRSIAVMLRAAVERAQRDVTRLEARLARSARAPRAGRARVPEKGEGASVPPSAAQSQLRARLENACGALDRAREREESLLAAIDRFYDERGDLMPVHADRNDAELLALFGASELAPFCSIEVITSRRSPKTVLEQMRAAALW